MFSTKKNSEDRSWSHFCFYLESSGDNFKGRSFTFGGFSCAPSRFWVFFEFCLCPPPKMTVDKSHF